MKLRQRLWWWHFRLLNHTGRFGKELYLVERFLQGARSVETAPCRGTSGAIEEPGLTIEWGGACPVQGEGTLDGHEVYYRARGEGWSFRVDMCGCGDVYGADAWVYSERPYFHPDGGWLAASVSEANIRKAVAKWREEHGTHD